MRISITRFTAVQNNIIMEMASDKLTILHFNDVYNVESRDKPEPIGGAARMKTAFKGFSKRNPLVIFCGDALSPSMCK